MAQEPRPDRRRKTRHRVVAVLVVLATVAALALASSYWSEVYRVHPEHDTTGLDGTWRDENGGKHTYRFLPHGEFDAAWGGLPMGELGTWERTGDRVIVHTVRNWDLDGILHGDAIRGHMIHLPDRTDLGPVVWKRESD